MRLVEEPVNLLHPILDVCDLLDRRDEGGGARVELDGALVEAANHLVHGDGVALDGLDLLHSPWKHQIEN